MSELQGNWSPEEQDRFVEAARIVDPDSFFMDSINRYLIQVGNAESLEEQGTTDIPSDYWYYRDLGLLDVISQCREDFLHAVEAVAAFQDSQKQMAEYFGLLQANTETLIAAQRKIAAADIITTADFEKETDS